MSSASSQIQSPASQELNLWNRIISELKNISKSKEQTDTLTAKVNKVHGKLQGFAENQKPFSQNAAVKLRELYTSTSDSLEKESRFSHIYIFLIPSRADFCKTFSRIFKFLLKFRRKMIKVL
jgi:hypothetical protein